MILNHRILGQGPPLIILHGLFGSLDNWMTIARHFSKSNTVYLVDLRNHGGSFHDHRFNYQVMSEDIRRFVVHFGISDPTIIGHSMGGKVAMFTTRLIPGDIRNLIVVDIGPKSYPVHHQLILEGLSSISPESISNRGQADDQLSRFVQEPGIRQFLLKNLKRSAGGNFEWKMNLSAIREQIANVGEALPINTIIQQPTLFIRGGSSKYIDNDDLDNINLQFPNSTINTVERAGHWVHAEAPEEFQMLVTSFLDH